MRALALRADVTVAEELESAVQRLEAEYGPLKAALNCAGIHSTAPAEDMPREVWQPDDSRAFSVRVDRPDHVWVGVGELLELAGERAEDPEWRAGFDAMVAYARSQGWVDEADRVRAHVEWRE